MSKIVATPVPLLRGVHVAWLLLNWLRAARLHPPTGEAQKGKKQVPLLATAQDLQLLEYGISFEVLHACGVQARWPQTGVGIRPNRRWIASNFFDTLPMIAPGIPDLSMILPTGEPCLG